MSADPSSPVPAGRRPIIRAIALVMAAGLFILVLALAAVSRLPMRGAELFGALANKIKGNPGATAVVSLIAATTLWLAIAVLVALQEWLARKRSHP